MSQAERTEISQAVILRLPRYYRYLEELMEIGVERISSAELSDRMGLTASQIRQDLNNFGGFGQQGYGYNVCMLYEEIGRILHIDRIHNLIVIGAGHLGQAIANYSNFSKRGFKICALFDRDPSIIGKEVNGIAVLPMDRIRDTVKEQNIIMAAICIPKGPAVSVCEELISCGIKGIWNFAHVDLKAPEDVVIENVHLSESLMRLSFRMGEM